MIAEGVRRRLHPAQEALRNGHCRDDSSIHVVQKQIPPYQGVSRSHRSFANLAMRRTRHLGKADRRRIQAVCPTCQCPNQPPSGSFQSHLPRYAVSKYSLKPDPVQESGRYPSVSGPLIIKASRSGMWGLGRSETRRISATGTPRSSMMIDSPATTRRTISLVLIKSRSKARQEFKSSTLARDFNGIRESSNILQIAALAMENLRDEFLDWLARN